MKKTLNLTLAGLLIFGFLAGQVNGQSVDDVKFNSGLEDSFFKME